MEKCSQVVPAIHRFRFWWWSRVHPEVRTCVPTRTRVALTDCLWYHDCWEPRLGCDADAKINQSVNFCTESSEIRSAFSDAAQNWIGAVQECLQETLASFVGGSIPQWISCPGIQRLADEAHRKCYIDIFKNITAFHVDVRDWLRIFVVTKSLLGDKFHADLSNSMSAVQDQLAKEQYSMDPVVGVYQFTLHAYDRYLGRPGGMKILNETIYSVVQSISEQLGWKSRHMEWYIHKFHSDDYETRVMLLLVDAKMLSKTNITSLTYGIQNAVDDLAAAVENGRIQVSFAGRVGLTYVIASLKTCSSSVDGNCVTSGSPSNAAVQHLVRSLEQRTFHQTPEVCRRGRCAERNDEVGRSGRGHWQTQVDRRLRDSCGGCRRFDGTGDCLHYS